MRRQLISANLFDDEFTAVHSLATKLNWNATETTSFLVRLGLKHVDNDSVKDQFLESLIESQFREFNKTESGKVYMQKQVEKALEEKMKERENASGEKN